MLPARGWKKKRTIANTLPASSWGTSPKNPSSMEIPVLHEDEDMLVVDKPAGITVFHESIAGSDLAITVIDALLEKYPDLKNIGEGPRYGVVHRLDKDTSGLLLVAKTPEALIFFQKQFKNRGVGKKYLALVTGAMKEDTGVIDARIGRSPMDPRKQKAYSPTETTPPSARDAVTEYNVLERFKPYTFLEVQIKTGRKHQIRCHLAYIHHPVAGDKTYRFKDSPTPEGLHRQFLHAHYLKIQLPSGQSKEVRSGLPEDLQTILTNLQQDAN